MKAVHIGHMDIKGGASRAGYGIFRSLSLLDINLIMLVQQKFSNDKDVINISDSWLKNRMTSIRTIMDLMPMYLFTHIKKGRFSFGQIGIDISKNKIIQEADLLHLHWINGGFLSLNNMLEIIDLKKPLFWTFHDMWPFTGGCHYSGNCERFMQSCGFCPYLKKPSLNDYSNQIWNNKKEIFKNADLNIVTPSYWLKECAEKSSLLKNFKINVIPYAIDINLFKPQDKKQARIELKLPLDKILILFGSMNTKDERKGFKYFKEALDILLSRNQSIREKIIILIFGKIDSGLESTIPFKTFYCGRIESDNKLVSLYNAADFFVTSSIEDNYPNTVMESLACGIPVLAFKIGGIPDLVKHLNNGYLVEFLSSDSLASGIEWFINNSSIRLKMGENARLDIIKNNSPEIIGEKYFALYNRALQTNPSK
jgi:glycosyltransferase involved in cell wall biosynthesis